MNVSIIIPLYNPDNYIIDEIKKSLKSQKFRGRYEILFEEGKGLAENINSGIMRAKYPIIVTLHQDCIPVGNDWLNNLIVPLKSKNCVASVSDVELPKKLWATFDIPAKILSAKEQKVLTPLLDEKGCAYKKKALIKIGLFDSDSFRSAGEDFDIYIKISRIGKIAYPHTKVLHYHKHTWKNRFRKEYQLANAFGTLVRIYGTKMPSYEKGFLKAIPLIGFIPLLLNCFDTKIIKYFFVSPFILFVAHVQYILGFWKGFLGGKQTV